MNIWHTCHTSSSAVCHLQTEGPDFGCFHVLLLHWNLPSSQWCWVIWNSRHHNWQEILLFYILLILLGFSISLKNYFNNWHKVCIDQLFKNIIHRSSIKSCQVGLPDTLLSVLFQSEAIFISGHRIILIIVEIQTESKQRCSCQCQGNRRNFCGYRIRHELLCAGPGLVYK